MIRNIIGVVAGLILSTLFIIFILYTGWRLYPLPESVDWFVPESYKNLDIKIYPGTYIFEILAYAISAFFGGMLTAGIVKTAKTAYAMLIGLLIFSFVMVKFALIPHPGWFKFLAPLPILPMGFLGGTLIEKYFTKKTNS